MSVTKYYKYIQNENYIFSQINTKFKNAPNMRLQATAQLAAKNHASSFVPLAQPQKQCHSTILKAPTLFSKVTLAVSLGAPEALAVGLLMLLSEVVKLWR